MKHDNTPSTGHTPGDGEIKKMSTEELQWRVDNPEAAKWFDAYKDGNKQFIEFAEKAIQLRQAHDTLKAENDKLRAANKELREALEGAEFVLRMIQGGIRVDRQKITDAGEKSLRVLNNTKDI